MSELHTGVWHEGSESHEITIETPESLKSARFFKQVSDIIWDSDEPMSYADVSTVRLQTAVSVGHAVGMASVAVYAVDEKLALTAGKKPVVLHGRDNLRGFIPADRLVAPSAAFIETKNQDCASRYARTGDEEVKRVVFTDGHVDYAREISLGFCYDFSDDAKLVLTYNMYRFEQFQDELIGLSVRAWFSPLATREYGQGEILDEHELSEEAEIRLLGIVSIIGGLSVREPGKP